MQCEVLKWKSLTAHVRTSQLADKLICDAFLRSVWLSEQTRPQRQTVLWNLFVWQLVVGVLWELEVLRSIQNLIKSTFMVCVVGSGRKQTPEYSLNIRCDICAALLNFPHWMFQVLNQMSRAAKKYLSSQDISVLRIDLLRNSNL